MRYVTAFALCVFLAACAPEPTATGRPSKSNATLRAEASWANTPTDAVRGSEIEIQISDPEHASQIAVVNISRGDDNSGWEDSVQIEFGAVGQGAAMYTIPANAMRLELTSEGLPPHFVNVHRP